MLSNKNIERVGDELELEKTCRNVQEADLSNNKFSDWDEVSLNKNKILKSLIYTRLKYNAGIYFFLAKII